jgi:hypothetical protein
VRLMEPITLILAALALGASTARQDEMSTAMRDAYARLQALVMKRFRHSAEAELVLARYESAPDVWEARLGEELSAAAAESDVELVETAQALLGLADRAGARSGKYKLTISGGQGVQVGDHGMQVNFFGGDVRAPRGPS